MIEIRSCPKCKSLNVKLDILTNQIRCDNCKFSGEFDKINKSAILDRYSPNIDNSKNKDPEIIIL